MSISGSVEIAPMLGRALHATDQAETITSKATQAASAAPASIAVRGAVRNLREE